MEKRTRIELHCHTKMSAGKGLIEPGELVRYANDNGYKAVAITDCGSVQAFPEAYHVWKELWEKHKEECRQRGEEARQEDFLKVIYGLEVFLMKDQKRYPILLYAKNETGIRNLYRIVTESHLRCNDEEPTIIKETLDQYREGILVGAVCDGGEAMDAIHEEGGKVVVQLHHAGRQSVPPYIFNEIPEAPSRVACPVLNFVPEAMSNERVWEIIDEYGDAAVRAKIAGADGVEVHGAHI